MTTQLPIESLEAGLYEADEQEGADDAAGVFGETGEQVETEIAHEEMERDARVDLLEGLREMQGAEGIRWRLYRVNADDPKMNGFLDELSTGQLTQKFLRDKFGGGTYRVRGYHVSSGKFKAGRTIRIAGDAQRATDSVNAQATGTASSFNLQEYIAQQDSRDRARRDEEERREERRRKERMELIALVAGPLSTVAAALLGKKDSTPDLAALITALKPERQLGPGDILGLLREMREMNSPPPQTDPIDKALGLVDRLRDMGGLGGLGGNGQGEVGLWDIVKEAVKTIGPGIGQTIQTLAEQAAAAKAMEAARAAQPRPDQPLLAAPARAAQPHSIPPSSAPGSTSAAPLLHQAPSAATAASPSSSPPAAPGHFPQSEDDMLLKLLPLLPWLKGETERLIVSAARGSDPGMRAAVMYDDLPEDADIEAVGTVLSRADWFNLFQQLDARVTPYRGFFETVRGELLAMIAEDTGVAFAIKDPAGIDPATGRQVVNVRTPVGRGARDPNAPIERPSGPPPITGEVFEGSEES